MDDIVDEVIQVEDNEQAKGAEDWDAPRGKQIEGEVFDLQRSGEGAHVDRDKAHLSAELSDRTLGTATVAAQKYLQSRTKNLSLPSSCAWIKTEGG